MRSTKFVRYALMTAVLMIASATIAAAQKIDCNTQSDTDLVISIYMKIKEKYPDAIRNINITADKGAIKLVGWVAGEKDLKKIVSIVKKVKCVKSVDNRLVPGKTGGCGPGQKECGGTCIGEKDVCNVCLIDPAAPGCGVSGDGTKKQ